MIKQGVIFVLMFVNLISVAQKNNDLEIIRSQFQVISSEADVQKIVSFQCKNTDSAEEQMIKAYQAAATCMMASYVFSPMSKLKYFNEGRRNLEELIVYEKEVENVYLRLLLQLNVPRILNYSKNIEDDVAYLKAHMAKSTIDVAYKNTMIKNLVSVTKKKELKDVLLKIDLEKQG